MTSKKAKETLDAVNGLFTVLTISGEITPELRKLFREYNVAVEVAKEALDIMDRDIKIEKKGDK